MEDEKRALVRAAAAEFSAGQTDLQRALEAIVAVGMAGDEFSDMLRITPAEVEALVGQHGLGVSSTELQSKLGRSRFSVLRYRKGDPVPDAQSDSWLGLDPGKMKELRQALRRVHPHARDNENHTVVDPDEFPAMPLKLSPAQAAHFLTSCVDDPGFGAVQSYFLFIGGAMVACDHGSRNASGHLKPGANIVQSPAIPVTVREFEAMLPKLTHSRGVLGTFHTLTFGFATTAVTVTLLERDACLIGISYPKTEYIYGRASEMRDKFASMIKMKVSTNIFFDKNAIEERANRPSFCDTSAIDDDARQPLALGGLANHTPEDLKAILSSETNERAERWGVDGFVFLHKKSQAKQPELIAQSKQLEDGNGRLRPEYAQALPNEVTVDLFNLLVSAQTRLQNAGSLSSITGDLRTFWVAFEDMVIGVNPFKVLGDNYFVVSLCSRKGDDDDPNFKYEFARSSIRRIIRAAAATPPRR